MSNERPISQQRICFIGAGSMAEAIIRGMVQKNLIPSNQIYAINRNRPEVLDLLHQKYGIQVTSEPDQRQQLVRQADIIVLAVKPKDAAAAIQEFDQQLHEQQVIVSVMAGMSIETLAALVPVAMPIVRTMPNTSSSIGKGVTGLSFSSDITDNMREIALEMFKAVGEVITVEENKLELITGLTGSGPAYIYAMMEAMSSVAIEEGLPAEAAKRLVAHTVLGAAQMVLQTGEDPADLRRKVTSPGGTTEAALKLMDERNFKETVKAAVLRSADKASEIGKALSRSSR